MTAYGSHGRHETPRPDNPDTGSPTMAQAPNSAANPASQAKHGEGAVLVTSRTISCDGGGGALGHPRTFYTIGDEGSVTCGYCGQVFVLDPNAPADGGH